MGATETGPSKKAPSTQSDESEPLSQAEPDDHLQENTAKNANGDSADESTHCITDWASI